MTIQERVRYLIDKYYAGNLANFARFINAKRETIQSYFDRGVKPSFVVLAKIVEKTGCNANWLLTGSGSAFEDEKPTTVEQMKELAGSDEIPDTDKLLKLIYQLELENKLSLKRLDKTQKQLDAALKLAKKSELNSVLAEKKLDELCEKVGKKIIKKYSAD